MYFLIFQLLLTDSWNQRLCQDGVLTKLLQNFSDVNVELGIDLVSVINASICNSGGLNQVAKFINVSNLQEMVCTSNEFFNMNI